MPQPYDPAGAMGGLFAPAYIHGNPQSEAAVTAWEAANHSMTNPGVDATRGPATTQTSGGMGSGRGLVGGLGSITTTLEGSVDPEALRALAQGGKYTPTAPAAAAAPAAVAGGAAGSRDAIANTLMNRGAGTLTPVGNGVYLPEFDTSGGGVRDMGYPWGQLGPNVSS